MFQTNPQQFPNKVLPTMYDLPSEDPEEPGLPDQFHIYQPRLLDETFQPSNYPSDQVLTATELNVYYDPSQTQWYKRPDWFAVVGVSRLYNNEDLRLSYVVWDEGVSPLIVIELLSPGTENEDLGKNPPYIPPNRGERGGSPPTKWTVYEEILCIPYYVTFDRYTNQIKAYQWTQRGYQPWELTNQGLWVEEIKMSLGLWSGQYEEMTRLWLRWRDEQGNWIPTSKEQTERERQRADVQQQRANRLATRLRELGIDPSEIN